MDYIGYTELCMFIILDLIVSPWQWVHCLTRSWFCFPGNCGLVIVSCILSLGPWLVFFHVYSCLGTAEVGDKDNSLKGCSTSTMCFLPILSLKKSNLICVCGFLKNTTPSISYEASDLFASRQFHVLILKPSFSSETWFLVVIFFSVFAYKPISFSYK